ncbi:MAG: SpoIIE family protein phosphatase [Terriglobia bacterium]
MQGRQGVIGLAADRLDDGFLVCVRGVCRIDCARHGLTEAQNEVLEMLGEARLQEVVENWDAASPEELCRSLVAAAERFGAAPQTDDLTVAALHYTQPGKA